MTCADYRAQAGRVHGPEGLSSGRPRPISRNRTTVLLLAALVALAAASPAAGSLRDRLDRALVAPGVSTSRTGAVVYDLARSSFVYRHNRSLALKPASNEKLPVAVTALWKLGPTTRIRTDVLRDGTLDPGGTLHGRLVLKGYGDPSLTSRKIATLAREVVNAGVRRITGAVLADETYFDRVRVAPGWKPSYYKDECPPLSALVVDRARYPHGIASNPARIAAWRLKRQLKALGVSVPGEVRRGRAASAAVLVARVRSAQVSALVRHMNRQSDNFYAEMLLKELGAAFGGGGTTADGKGVVRRELRRRGVPLRGVVLADGSGLSSYDRLTARSVALLLISAFSDSAIGGYLVGSLPLAGVNGTLADRMREPPAYRNVRAKTGTTDAASALSGYVRSRYVFAILMNGSPIPWWYARQAQDRFAQVLAGQ